MLRTALSAVHTSAPRRRGQATQVVLRASLSLLLAATALSLATSAPAAARAACTTVQLTDATGGFTFLPSVSGDGTRVAFGSNRDHTGDNPDGNSEIFLHDTTDGTTTQLTNTDGDFSTQPSTSTDGTRIAFRSDADHTGDNADGNSEIFSHDTTDGTTTQLSDTTTSGSSAEPAITGDGTRIAFRSDADLTGDNADGNREIFLHDTTDGTTTQLTDTTSGSSSLPTVSDDGTRIAFESTADHTGDNPDRNGEIFLHDTTDDATTQLTDTTNSEFSTEPAITGDGTRIAFPSDADHTGENPDGTFEVFVFDTTDSTTTQLTDTTNSEFSTEPAISADGTRIAFRSDADPTGDNPDGGDKIFLATCGSPAPSFNDVGLPHPFFAEIEWLAEVEVTGGFPDGGYHPAAPVSRQAMAAFMIRLAGQPPFALPAEPSFDDVSTTHPFFAEIEWLAAVEIAGGFPDGGYHPAAPVTRQAMAAFMFRLAGQPPFDLPGTPTFDDVSTGHPFFAEIEWLAAVEVTGGFPDGGYHPAAPVTRQAMAAFMFRLADGPGVDLTGDNPDGNAEIFLVDTILGTTTQLTDSAGDGSGDASLRR